MYILYTYVYINFAFPRNTYRSFLFSILTKKINLLYKKYCKKKKEISPLKDTAGLPL